MTDEPTHSPRSTFRLIAITVAVLNAVGLIAIMGKVLLRPEGSSVSASLAKGHPVPAPPFDLEVLNIGTLRPELRYLAPKFADGRLTNDELRGTPVVLNLWASWCGPCRGEAPALKAVSESPDAEDVLFLGLNSLDGKTAARAFVAEHRLTYPNIREYEDTVSRDFGARAFPETFFIDRRGRVVGRIIGAISTKQLQAGIAAARDGRINPPARGGAQGTR